MLQKHVNPFLKITIDNQSQLPTATAELRIYLCLQLSQVEL